MDIHHYNPDTGEYLNTTKARLDPMATAREGNPVYRVPAYATTTKPSKETPDDHANVFKGGKWVYSKIVTLDNQKIPEAVLSDEEKKEALIQSEMTAILREQAEARLKERGVL